MINNHALQKSNPSRVTRSNVLPALGLSLICSLSVLVLNQPATAESMTKEIHTTMQVPAHAGQSSETSKSSKSTSEQSTWTKDQQRQAALEKKYKEDIANDPQNKKNYAYLAGVYLANNKSAKAITAYREAIMHDPENPKLFAAMSIAYLHQSKFAMAKEMADQALKIDPSLKSVNKINQYITAKKEAIDMASKVPAGGKIPDMSGFSKKNGAGHGSILSTATGNKPADKTHKPH